MDPLSTGLGAFGAILNMSSQNRQNLESRKFAIDAMQWKHDKAIEFWNMQNEYNSPAAARQRLIDGGYNPAMMYGNSGAAGTASPLDVPDIQQPQFKTPHASAFDLGKFFDIEVKRAQVDNLAADNTVKLETAAQIAANTDLLKTRNRAENLKFDLESDLYDTSADYRRAALRKLNADIDYTVSENERKAALNTSNLNEAAERILTMRIGRKQTSALIRSTNLGNKIKQLDIDLKKQGIQPSDPLYIRVLGRLIQSVIPERFISRSQPPLSGGNGW